MTKSLQCYHLFSRQVFLRQYEFFILPTISNLFASAFSVVSKFGFINAIIDMSKLIKLKFFIRLLFWLLFCVLDTSIILFHNYHTNFYCKSIRNIFISQPGCYIVTIYVQFWFKLMSVTSIIQFPCFPSCRLAERITRLWQQKVISNQKLRFVIHISFPETYILSMFLSKDHPNNSVTNLCLVSSTLMFYEDACIYVKKLWPVANILII